MTSDVGRGGVDPRYRPGPFIREMLLETGRAPTTQLFDSFKARCQAPRLIEVRIGEAGGEVERVTEESGYYHKVPTYDSFRRYLYLLESLGTIRHYESPPGEVHYEPSQSRPYLATREGIAPQVIALWELTPYGRGLPGDDAHWLSPWSVARADFGWESTTGWPDPTEEQKERLKEFQTKHRYLKAATRGKPVGKPRPPAAPPGLPRRRARREVVERAIYGPPRPEYVERERELAEQRRAHRLRGVAARRARQRLEQQWASLHGVGVGASVRLEDGRTGTVRSIAEGMASVEIEGREHVVRLLSLRPT